MTARSRPDPAPPPLPNDAERRWLGRARVARAWIAVLAAAAALLPALAAGVAAVVRALR